MTEGSSKPRIILDTKPLIKLFAREKGWEAVQRISTKMENDEIEAAISVVTLTEVSYIYLNEKRPDLARARTEDLRYAIYLRKLGIDEEVAVKAGELKGRYNVSIADAFIAATAHLEGATIISGDPDFKRMPEVETLTEDEFLSKLPR